MTSTQLWRVRAKNNAQSLPELHFTTSLLRSWAHRWAKHGAKHVHWRTPTPRSAPPSPATTTQRLAGRSPVKFVPMDVDAETPRGIQREIRWHPREILSPPLLDFNSTCCLFPWASNASWSRWDSHGYRPVAINRQILKYRYSHRQAYDPIETSTNRKATQILQQTNIRLIKVACECNFMKSSLSVCGSGSDDGIGYGIT